MKEVALIFDDGPNPKITPKLLEVLQEKGVPANFFLIGKRAEEYPDVVRQIAVGGHEIGNHGYTHKHLAELLSQNGQAAVAEEIEKSHQTLKLLSGQEIKFFRPPYLDWNDQVTKIAAPLYQDRIIMNRLAVADYDWGDNNYWDENDQAATAAQADKILKASQQAAANGAILAFHDSAEHNLPGNMHTETWMNRALPTLEAVPELIDYLLGHGFTIKKLSDMQSLL